MHHKGSITAGPKQRHTLSSRFAVIAMADLATSVITCAPVHQGQHQLAIEAASQLYHDLQGPLHQRPEQHRFVQFLSFIFYFRFFELFSVFSLKIRIPHSILKNFCIGHIIKNGCIYVSHM